jgi:peptidoglycan/LPS O-acetylase OafA/YrhL
MAKEKIDWRPAAAIITAWLVLAFAGKECDILTRPFFWVQVFLFMGFMGLVIRKGITLRAVEWIGQMSYSMYLFHFAVIDLVFAPFADRFLTGVPQYLLGLFGTVLVTGGVTWISSKTLEAWSSAWAKKCIERIKPDPETASSPIIRTGE